MQNVKENNQKHKIANTNWSLATNTGICRIQLFIHSKHFVILFLSITLYVHHGLVIIVLKDNGIIISIDFYAISSASGTKRWIRTIHMHKNLSSFKKLNLLMFRNQKFWSLWPMWRMFPSKNPLIPTKPRTKKLPMLWETTSMFITLSTGFACHWAGYITCHFTHRTRFLFYVHTAYGPSPFQTWRRRIIRSTSIWWRSRMNWGRNMIRNHCMPTYPSVHRWSSWRRHARFGRVGVAS